MSEEDKCKRLASNFRCHEERDIKAYENAEKIDSDNYAGMLFVEWLGHEYFENTEDLIACLREERSRYDENDNEIPPEIPKHIWAVNAQSFISVHLSDVLGTISDTPEYWDSKDVEGLDELKIALEKFNAANEPHKIWIPDMTRAIIIKPEKVAIK